MNVYNIYARHKIRTKLQAWYFIEGQLTHPTWKDSINYYRYIYEKKRKK